MFYRRDGEAAAGEELAPIEEGLGIIPLVGFFGKRGVSHNRLYAYTGVLTLFV